ncbi:MAG: hypothetical protein K2G88_10830 [Oscillospiraceae bacterium]|nr:hypothetical protein [Oscillospiraceae bacterium]
MTETKKADFINFAMSMFNQKYGLDIKEFSTMLELLGSITHQQCETISAICTSFTAKDVMKKNKEDTKI